MGSGRKTIRLRILGIGIIVITIFVVLQLVGAVDLFRVFPSTQQTGMSGKTEPGIVGESELTDDEPFDSYPGTPAELFGEESFWGDNGFRCH